MLFVRILYLYIYLPMGVYTNKYWQTTKTKNAAKEHSEKVKTTTSLHIFIYK